ncbi:DSD1 family PLP-dependent enzyme [Pedosphaera parvula]|uniref:Alanine racemase domain protein n=1 Tax=Pedosphaera parvula (strain Ellin514) TaxID=320771 RepID=B9XF25_PEDPL|nr:DSD1 family PLP-dependent enzyme [Pedosphaera parvula]EEF61523.1 alanine racemase domain protein [Pedosphaera parvula Ellin514]
MNSTNPNNWKGLPLAEVDTPSLLLDADALQANIDRMAAFFVNRPSGLRPHFKSHKCTKIVRLQMQAGAVGITCAKLGEAEVLADAGIREILIANQIVGHVKIARLIQLAKRAAPIVAVDSEENARMLSAAASAANVEIRALVEVDIGLNRCGVKSGAPALALTRLIASLPGIKFEGLQGYEGHLVDLPDEAERAEKTRAALKPLVETRRLIESSGIPVNIVTGGSTGTYTFTGDFPGVDEVQAGSYAAMDWYYFDIRPEFRQAMSILTTVISRPAPDIAIVDVGRKGVGAEFGPPRVKDLPGASIARFGSEEHASISLPKDCNMSVGDHLELIPSHGCTTSNLYREFIVHRHGVVEDVWPIEGSGQMR